MRKGHFKILFLLPFLVLSSCSEKRNEINLTIQKSEKLLLIYDSSDFYALECVENARMSFRYAKLLYDEIDLKNYKGGELSKLGNYFAIALATEFIKKLTKSDCENLKSFVSSGGGLAVIYRGYNENLHDIFGVKIMDKNQPFLKQGRSGLHFKTDFIPGLKGTAISDSIIRDLSMFDFVHVGDKNIIATTSSGTPVVWNLRYGKGKVTYWNSSILSNRTFRGFITQTIASVSSKFVQPIANFSVIFIDDFPTSVPNAVKKIVWDEFKMNLAEFHFLVFYPDMLKLSNEFGLKYTAGLVFNYGASITPPFHLNEWRIGKASVLSKEIEVSKTIAKQLKINHELGFHGYNHVPLLVDEWENIENMKRAIEYAMKKWKEEGLGNPPVTYIPPTNLIDSIGVQALAQSAPSIKVIAGLYAGFFELGQRREFGPEPWNGKFYCIPRVSAGFMIDDYTKTIILSAIAMLGVWTHFIHPDDVIYTPEEVENPELVRNWFSLPWRGAKEEGLYFKFRDWVKTLKENYPYLRFMKCEDAYEEMKKFDDLKIEYEFSNDEIKTKTNQKDVFIIVQFDTVYKSVDVLNANIIHHGQTSTTNYVILKTESESIILKLKTKATGQG
jgi:hypothetical protein